MKKAKDIINERLRIRYSKKPDVNKDQKEGGRSFPGGGYSSRYPHSGRRLRGSRWFYNLLRNY